MITAIKIKPERQKDTGIGIKSYLAKDRNRRWRRFGWNLDLNVVFLRNANMILHVQHRNGLLTDNFRFRYHLRAHDHLQSPFRNEINR